MRLKFTSCIMEMLLTVNKRGFVIVSTLLIIAEAILCSAIIRWIPYTEIDWSTYMQQVECYLNGIYNYSLIHGDTGPIVYPAGHLFVYRLFYSLTKRGTDVQSAQYIFGCIYIANLLLILRLYYRSSVIPPIAVIPICIMSYRVHSIFLLRMFNDPIAIFIFYCAVNFWLSQHWSFGCILFSLAVSIKMNILLFSPSVFVILLISTGIRKTVALIFTCAIVQIALGLPFLMTDPLSYIKRSFDLGRVFLFKWTVNWRFLPETIFLSQRFHVFLLALYACVLISFSSICWFRKQGGFVQLLKFASHHILSSLSVDEVLFALFTGNFIGVCFARSLHYQFYVWYFHTLPYLLFSDFPLIYVNKGCDHQSKNLKLQDLWFPVILRLSILLGIEVCWNVYPSTFWSSLMLHTFHLIILAMLMSSRYESGKNESAVQRKIKFT